VAFFPLRYTRVETGGTAATPELPSRGISECVRAIGQECLIVRRARETTSRLSEAMRELADWRMDMRYGDALFSAVPGFHCLRHERMAIWDVLDVGSALDCADWPLSIRRCCLPDCLHHTRDLRGNTMSRNCSYRAVRRTALVRRQRDHCRPRLWLASAPRAFLGRISLGSHVPIAPEFWFDALPLCARKAYRRP
jgi:hypothetical protein